MSHFTVAAGLRALPDHRLLDGLLRSRAWIWLLGVALGGIVFMQVSLLQMNNGIGNAVAQSTEIEHQNALLSEEVARMSGGDKIRAAAAAGGLVSPDASTLGFVEAGGEGDALRAAQNMTPPSETAQATEAAPVAPVADVPPVATVAPEVTAEPVATADPLATVAPEVTAAPTAVVPVETAVAPTPTDYEAGAAAAPTP